MGRAMRLALTLLAVLALACGSPPIIRPVPPEPIPEPPAPADAGADAGTSCERAEARLRALDCRRPDGHPYYETRHGSPFSEACASAMQDGRNWKPECLERIADCSEVACAFAGECC